MKIPRLIDAKMLCLLIKDSKTPLKLLDCTYTLHTPRPIDYPEFHVHQYGNFEELLKIPQDYKTTFLSSHIPHAVHFDMQIGTYPSLYDKYSLYEPEVFERYVQLLGLNEEEHVVLYGRGPYGGMLWPAKIYLMFRTYGHEDVSILNGGFEAWIRGGYPIETFETWPKIELGNWKAKKFDLQKFHITYEELVQDEPENSNGLHNLSQKSNILDARVRGQYNGVHDHGLGHGIQGSFIPGTKNVPVIELVDDNGKMKSKEEIDKYLKQVDFDPNKSTITMCNRGIQASMLAFILEEVHPKIHSRIFSGSMKEMAVRNPKKISGRPTH